MVWMDPRGKGPIVQATRNGAESNLFMIPTPIGETASQDSTAEVRVKYISRDEALNGLSDNEAARVSAAESLAQLSHGDEYLDLHHLDHGVRTATAHASAIGGVLPRKSVSEGTWHKLVAHTPEPQPIQKPGPSVSTLTTTPSSKTTRRI